MNDQKLIKSVDLRLASMLFTSVLPRGLIYRTGTITLSQ